MVREKKLTEGPASELKLKAFTIKLRHRIARIRSILIDSVTGSVTGMAAREARVLISWIL